MAKRKLMAKRKIRQAYQSASISREAAKQAARIRKVVKKVCNG